MVLDAFGEVPEWLNGTVSKTVVVLVATVGSNPTLSANIKTLKVSAPSECFAKTFRV